jgi:hypothetical protein
MPTFEPVLVPNRGTFSSSDDCTVGAGSQDAMYNGPDCEKLLDDNKGHYDD